MPNGPKRSEPRWLDVQRRSFSRTYANGKTVAGELPYWYGRMNVAGKWKWFKLYTDKRASQVRWAEIVRESEQKLAGVITTQMDAAKLPLSEHLTAYLDGLSRTVSKGHYTIASAMLKRFVALAGWQSLADINEQSASRVLSAIQGKGLTVAYANQYLARIKAFLNWCIPDRLLVNPLAKLKRGNLKRAMKRRARRPLAEHELSKLLTTCNASRRLKYAFPAYSGLRRRELADVRWGDLHLDSMIPYIQLRPEQTKTGEATALPLHPFIVAELRKLTQAMPDTKLFSVLPEGRTLLRDLTKAGVTQTDAMGRRADFHGLRHTFATRLDATGCSHATRRALMRHSAGDQTDGYTLARLAEMYEAVKRLAVPGDIQTQSDLRTGTDSVDIPRTNAAPSSASIGPNKTIPSRSVSVDFTLKKQGDCIDRHPSASIGLLQLANRDSVAEVGPHSSVGHADSDSSLDNPIVSASSGHTVDKLGSDAASLSRVVDAWPTLPPSVKSKINALVNAAIK